MPNATVVEDLVGAAYESTGPATQAGDTGGNRAPRKMQPRRLRLYHDPPPANPEASRKGGRDRRLTLTPASAIQSERTRWLWRERVPLRGLTVLAGEKGLGKSILTNAWLVGKLTRGDLDGELHGEPTDVLIVTAEDDWRSVVKPRLIAHGAALDRVHRIVVSDDAGETLLTLPDDVPPLEAEIAALRADGRTVGLIVIDPISAFLAESIDSPRRLRPPRHRPRGRDGLPRQCGGDHRRAPHQGRKQEGARARQRLRRLRQRGPERPLSRTRPTGPGGPSGPRAGDCSRRVQLGPLRSFVVAPRRSRHVEVDDGSHADVGYISVIGETSIGVDDLQNGADQHGSEPREAIVVALADGARRSREVKTQIATEIGCCAKTVERAGMRMAERGEAPLIVSQGSGTRTTTWTCNAPWARERSAAGTPCPDRPAAGTRDRTVGTLPDTRLVPTGGKDVPAAPRRLSRDSGDAPEALADAELIERAERLLARRADEFDEEKHMSPAHSEAQADTTRGRTGAGDRGAGGARANRNRTEHRWGATSVRRRTCPDPHRCAHRHRYPTGPWTCAHNHPHHAAAS